MDDGPGVTPTRRAPDMTEPRPPLHVLVVEDSADAAQSTAALLTLYGHTVRIARTGAEAIQSALADPPDVVLLDIGLPGMNGWEVARELRQQSTGLPPFIVAVTGYGADDALQRSTESGMDLHLVKPVDPSVLGGLLDRFARKLGTAGGDEGLRTDGPAAVPPAPP
jgi:two-component system OmpR family response regulator